MSSDSPGGNGGNDKKTEEQKQQQRAKEAAKVAAGGKSTVQTRFTPRGGGESSKDIPPGAYSYASQAPQRSLVKAGDGFLTSGTGDNKSVVRGSTPEERARAMEGGGNDNGGGAAPAKAVAEKPAEPVLSPEEQEQQRLAAEIRQRRRRVAGYRSLLSPTRQDDLSGTLGGGGTV